MGPAIEIDLHLDRICAAQREGWPRLRPRFGPSAYDTNLLPLRRLLAKGRARRIDRRNGRTTRATPALGQRRTGIGMSAHFRRQNDSPGLRRALHLTVDVILFAWRPAWRRRGRWMGGAFDSAPRRVECGAYRSGRLVGSSA